MAWRPVVDTGPCTLCEGCIAVCPSVFRYNEAGFIEVVEADDYPLDEVREAIKHCPADCIRQEGDE